MPNRRAAPLPEAIAARLPQSDKPGNIVFRAAAEGPAELLLYGEVGWEITALGIADALKAAGPTAPVNVRINSVGGSVFEGFAAYNTLARHNGPVTVTVDGVAASMASLIAMAGDVIAMPVTSIMMIHNPSGFVVGEATDMRDLADLLDQLREPMIATYAARTGQSRDAIVAMMDAETWMTAETAQQNGFADQVEQPGEAPPAARLDLNPFAKVPMAVLAMATRPPAAPPAAAGAFHAGHQPAREAPAATQEHRMPPENPAGVAPANPSPAAAVTTPPVATLGELQAVATRARLDSDWIVGQLAAGATLDGARDAAIDLVAARAQPVGRPQNPAAVLIADENDKRFEAMANALEHRAAPGRVELTAEGRGFRGMSLSDMARECLEAQGVRTRGMTRMEVAEAALSARRYGGFRGAGELTSSDFPNLLANVANKSLRAAYVEAPRTFLPWCRQSDLPDFKDARMIALSGAPDLRQLPESGEVSYGTVTDGAEIWHLLRFGKAITLSYVAIVNDDLGGFTRLPAMFAASAARLESDRVYGTLLANAALADGTALFHANHGNLLTGAGTSLTADATGVANVGKLATLMAKQTAPGTSSPLNLTGRYLLSGPSLEPAALQLWSGRLVPNEAGFVNPYVNIYQPITEARLELGTTWINADGSTTVNAGSATAFYLMSSPNMIDTMVYGYLEGEDGPRLTQDIEFDTDGMSIKVVHNFGTKAVDFRGMTKSAGA